MEVLSLTIFISLVLVVAALLFFVWTLHQRSHEHADRLALLPLDDAETENVCPGQESHQQRTHRPPCA